MSFLPFTVPSGWKVAEYFSDVAQVCRKGHVITRASKTYPNSKRAFCEQCGSSTLVACDTCKQEIVGANVRKLVWDVFSATSSPSEVSYQIADEYSGTKPPPHCGGCGAAFPWAASDKLTSPLPLSLQQLLARVPRVVAQLRRRQRERPTLDVKDEYDLQDLLHSLLTLLADDIRPEEWTPSHAGQSARMDFLLKDEKTVLELKHTREHLGATEVGNELILDIERYKTHPDCKRLVCFVFDPGKRIANPRGLEKDLSGERDGLSVLVIVEQ